MRLLTLIIIILVLSSKFTYAEFQYSKVTYWIGYVHGEWINLTARFINVKTDAMSKPIPYFEMGFDGNIKRGNFHSVRFDGKSFSL
tara:strand:+ start:203 stop:460 length:258 start_codon:yes stop_codon:yes gene_type:complete